MSCPFSGKEKRVMEKEKSKKTKKISERTRTLFLFTVPSVVMYTVFFTVTMAIGIYYSFTDWNGISASYKLIGFGNYVKAMMDRKFLAALKFNFGGADLE